MSRFQEVVVEEVPSEIRVKRNSVSANEVNFGSKCLEKDLLMQIQDWGLEVL